MDGSSQQKGGFGGCPPAPKTGTRSALRGFAKGWFSKRVVLADVPWTPRTRTRVQKAERGHKNKTTLLQNRPFVSSRTFGCSPVPKQGRGHIRVFPCTKNRDEVTAGALAQDKSTAFAVGMKAPELYSSDVRVSTPPSFRYLGCQVQLVARSPRPLLEQRITAATRTMRKIAQLPGRLLIDVRAVVLASTALPQLTYGLQDRPIAKQILAKLETMARAALWRGKKKMHAWSLACVFVYRTHRVHVTSAFVYEHCAYVLRALHAQADGEISKLFQTVMEGPIPHTPRGPLQLFLHNILSSGIERMQPWHRVRYRGREFSLQDIPLPESLHILREALRNTLLQQSRRERPAFEGIERADIGITTAIIRPCPLKRFYFFVWLFGLCAFH